MTLGGLRIKLVRFGFVKRPFYFFAVAWKRSAPKTGSRFEDVGWWDPTKGEDGNQHMGLKFDRIKYWLTAGAQPTDKVAQLLGRAGVIPPPPARPSRPHDPKDDIKWRPDMGEDKKKK